MKKLLIALTAFIFILGSSTSCKKKEKSPCLAPDTIYNAFYPSEIGKIPYGGFDTLKFKDEITGKIHIFIGQGIDTSLTYYQRWFPDMCPEQFEKCQSNLIKYQSSTFPNPIYIHAHKPYGLGLGYLTIKFDRVDYFHDLVTIGSGGYTDTINGHIYTNINNIDMYFSTSTNHIKYNTYEGIIQVVYENKLYSREK